MLIKYHYLTAISRSINSARYNHFQLFSLINKNVTRINRPLVVYSLFQINLFKNHLFDFNIIIQKKTMIQVKSSEPTGSVTTFPILKSVK